MINLLPRTRLRKTRRNRTDICSKYACSEQGCSQDRDFYLDVDVPIFACSFNSVLLTSISHAPHFLVWRLRKNLSACFNIDTWSVTDSYVISFS